MHHTIRKIWRWCLQSLLVGLLVSLVSEIDTTRAESADDTEEPWLAARMLEIPFLFSIEPVSDAVESRMNDTGESHEICVLVYPTFFLYPMNSVWVWRIGNHIIIIITVDARSDVVMTIIYTKRLGMPERSMWITRSFTII